MQEVVAMLVAGAAAASILIVTADNRGWFNGSKSTITIGDNGGKSLNLGTTTDSTSVEVIEPVPIPTVQASNITAEAAPMVNAKDAIETHVESPASSLMAPSALVVAPVVATETSETVVKKRAKSKRTRKTSTRKRRTVRKKSKAVKQSVNAAAAS